MNSRISAILIALTISATGHAAPPTFEMQEIDTALKIGYAVILEDLNGDKKPDIIVVDQHKIVWYENSPTWKKRIILNGKTKPDNVCITALDIDGNGDLELVVGAGWKPFDTKTPGTLQWLKRGQSLDDEWTMHPIPCDEPTVHRIRVGDMDHDGTQELIVAPLMGREATREHNWLDGRPVRILAYPIPKNPTDPNAWKSRVISQELHVVHNIEVIADYRMYKTGNRYEYDLFAASYEGVTHYDARLGVNADGTLKPEFERTRLGDQSNPKGSRGSSEIAAMRRWPNFERVATVEPWHGNSFVFYLHTGARSADAPHGYRRIVLDNQLRWGHAIKLVDLDGDDVPEVIGGVRDDPAKGDPFTARRGVRVYRSLDGKCENWDRFIIDDGGVAVEDLAVGDLNGDRKPDIVAVGRATGNCRIYWNRTK
jgi:FG-GAP-like repeat